MNFKNLIGLEWNNAEVLLILAEYHYKTFSKSELFGQQRHVIYNRYGQVCTHLIVVDQIVTKCVLSR